MLLVVGAVLAAFGALVHGYIFMLESVLWQGPRARRIFGTTVEDARITAPLALNQGFYNLFLAVDGAMGLVLLAAGKQGAGITALLIGTGSMAAAGVVLVVSDPSKVRAAAVQAVVPAVAIVLLAVGCATA